MWKIKGTVTIDKDIDNGSSPHNIKLSNYIYHNYTLVGEKVMNRPSVSMSDML